jgi:oxygen-dependent protoporphyrinogen oxidase
MRMKICIVGGGISGLSAALLVKNKAKKLGLPVAITLFEKENRLGGTIFTKTEKNFQIEAGPNGFLNSKPFTLDLFNIAGLQDLIIRSNDAARIRYIYRNGLLEKVPEGGVEFFKSGLISFKGKLRILGEFFIPAKRDNGDETIANFAKRRLGAEAKDYMIAPMVSGIFAGDISKLSLKSCFPVIYELEKKYGGLFKGLIKKKNKKSGPAGPKGILMSCKGGLFNGIIALKNKCDDVNFLMDEKILSINKGDHNFIIHSNKCQYVFDKVVLAVPAYDIASIVENLNKRLSELFFDIPYAPACVVGLGFKDADLVDNLNGFGFLIPPKENKKILGILFSSSIFPERAPKGYKLIRIIMGGDMGRWIVNKSREELIKIAYDEAMDILKFSGDPYITEFFMYEKAIPQYYIGHSEKVEEIENILNKSVGLYIGGNTLYGIGVNDCTHQSFNIADKIFS